jgi:BRO family, N-terminal domain
MSLRFSRIVQVPNNEQWYFSIVDVIEILTDSPTPSKYWGKVKNRMKEETLNDLSPNWGKLKLKGLDGKYYKTDCAYANGIFRIVMSVPSPKAEPLDAQGFEENKDKAEKGGKASGVVLKTYEAETGLKVVSTQNFLKASDDTKELPTD